MALLSKTMSPASPDESVRVRSWASIAAFAVAVVACVLVLQSSGHSKVAALGYLLGALVAPGLAVSHRFLVRTARRSLNYIRRRYLDRLAIAALLLGGVAGIVHAWFFATQLAKK